MTPTCRSQQTGCRERAVRDTAPCGCRQAREAWRALHARWGTAATTARTELANSTTSVPKAPFMTGPLSRTRLSGQPPPDRVPAEPGLLASVRAWQAERVLGDEVEDHLLRHRADLQHPQQEPVV